METVITIETTRYSRAIRAILEAYADSSVVTVDQTEYRGHEVSDLLESWCTNRKITNTLNFSVARGGATIFAFHDHPRHLWAASSEREFAQQLERRGIARIRELPVRPGWANRLAGWLKRRLPSR